MILLKKIKVFADEKGVSPQAIYKHIKKHRDDLKDHIKKCPDGNYLDNYACDYISSLMIRKSIVVVEETENEKRLKKENENLQKELDHYKNKIIDLQIQLLEASNLASQRLLLEKDKEVLENDNQRLKKLENELKEEIKSYKPIAFGLYKKKK